jgi:phosphoenolpyruvate carboxykinase (GTP)
MGDYWQHWLNMGKIIKNQPKIFNVNWFRLDDNGKFIWPGFGDNMRVLEWIMDRCFDEADAVESPIGYLPKAEDIDLEGLDISMDTLKDLLTVDMNIWKEEAAGIRKFYTGFGDKMPKELTDELNKLEEKLK